MKARAPRVAVITTRNDAHLPFVQEHLDHPFVVLDPRELIGGKEVSYRLVNDEILVSAGGEVLDNVVGVWYRKPQPILRRELPVHDDFKLYSQNAMERHALQLLTAFDRATWVSPYFSIISANNKTWQLAIARRVGFNVPDTIVTSSPEVAEGFINTYPRCITKPLTVAYPKVNGEQKVMFASVIDKHFKPKLENLYLAPSIFQQAIEVQHDVRVIVVGDKAFPAIIQSQLKAEPRTEQISRVRDNRIGHYEGTVHIEEFKNFPKELAGQCVAHTKELGLNFGALDLILDPKGKWWFLENNPNGQWAYIEQETTQPIGKTIAELLTTSVQ